MAERPGHNNSPSLHQASVNQPQQPQRSIPTPQQNFVSSATPQSNLTQIPSHVPANGLPTNGVLAQINGAAQHQSPQITHPPSQQPIPLNKLPSLPEDRLKVALCSSLDLRVLGSMNVTSLLMANQSTFGLCIRRCSCGTGLNQYVLYNFPLNRSSNQDLC